MLKYVTVALGLKAFSSCSLGERWYRRLGNRLGGASRARTEMPAYYLERVQRMLDLVGRLKIIEDGSRVLELGTGWVHWEALSTRLFYEIEATLFDVWDNRQLPALQSYLTQLICQLDQLRSVSGERLSRARSLATELSHVENFEQLYERLNFRYHLEPTGSLSGIEADSYDVVVSAGVFEHLPKEQVPGYIRDSFRLLKPGAFAVHSINTTDHLYLYDRTANPKQYLSYSDTTWRLLFQNKIQYINRLQRDEWMKIFSDAGFELVEEQCSRCNLGELRICAQVPADG